MSKLTIDGETHEVESGQRLVQAIEDCGTNIGHRCGGYAKCTTCRVTFEEGEPETMTKAEYDKLSGSGKMGEFRLACQILTADDMTVNVLMTKESTGWDDTGPEVEEDVTPDPRWFSKDELTDDE